MQIIKIRQSDGTLRQYRNAEFIPAFLMIPEVLLNRTNQEMITLKRTPRALFTDPETMQRVESDNFLQVVIDVYAYLAWPYMGVHGKMAVMIRFGSLHMPRRCGSVKWKNCRFYRRSGISIGRRCRIPISISASCRRRRSLQLWKPSYRMLWRSMAFMRCISMSESIAVTRTSVHAGALIRPIPMSAGITRIQSTRRRFPRMCCGLKTIQSRISVSTPTASWRSLFGIGSKQRRSGTRCPKLIKRSSGCAGTI